MYDYFYQWMWRDWNPLCVPDGRFIPSRSMVIKGKIRRKRQKRMR